MGEIRIKRIYEAAEQDDGARILVDRLWPRGIRKEDADILLWEKGIAPSNELRKWFGHDPEKYQEFMTRYEAELDSSEISDGFADKVSELQKAGNVTLLYAAKDTEHNNAAVLREWITAFYH